MNRSTDPDPMGKKIKLGKYWNSKSPKIKTTSNSESGNQIVPFSQEKV